MTMDTIGFIGAGQMATMLALGFLKAGGVDAKHLFASDVDPLSVEKFASSTGATVCASNAELVKNAETVFLAVKPQQMKEVLEEIVAEKEIVAENVADRLYVSIAAGLSIAFFEKYLGKTSRIIRVMPNTPCFVAEGVCAFAPSNAATGKDVEQVRSLLQTVGIAEQVSEKQMDAVTGLSGSGPAFVYLMIEALSDAGVKMGLSRSTALRFAAQTLKGAAEMVLKTGEHPAVLKDRVTSPAGTTIAGIKALEDASVRSALISAVEAATNRSMELSQL